MRTRILESIKFDVSEADIEKSKEAKKHLTGKLREWPIIESSKRELREKTWEISEKLRRAVFLDLKEEVIQLRADLSKLRHQIGDIEAAYNNELAERRREVYKVNFPVRKALIEILNGLYHSKGMKPAWDLKSIQPYWKDRGINKGIETINRYTVKTNREAVQKIKEEIMMFIKDVGGVVSSSNRDHWEGSLATGIFRELCISEIFTEVEKFEKKLNEVDVESLIEKEIGEGELQSLKIQERAA